MIRQIEIEGQDFDVSTHDAVIKSGDTELLDWLEAQSADKNMKFKVNGDGSVYVLCESQNYVGCAPTLREAIRKAMEGEKQ